MNYAAMPFMLLTVRDSLRGWSAVDWYGHVLVFGGLGFFYPGGSRYLKRLQARRVKKVDARKEDSGALTGAATPSAMTIPPVDIALDEVDKKL